MTAQPNQNTQQLTQTVNRQRMLIESLRLKCFSLQSAIVAMSGMIPEHSEPAAELFPVEKRSGENDDLRVFAFGGMAMRLGMAPREFFNTFSAASPTIYFLKDFYQCWYHKGLLGLTGDIPSTAKYIANLKKPGSRSVAFGSSAGGYAAILFGVLAGIDHIVAFGPQTSLTPAVIARFRNIETGLKDINRDPIFSDLAVLLDEVSYDGKIDLYYASEHIADSEAAENLRRFPNVRLFPVEASGHNVAGHLRMSGALNEITTAVLNDAGAS